MTFNRLLCAAAFSVSGLAWAQEPASAVQAAPAEAPPAPSADEIKRVGAYYLRGKDAGPILVEFSLCSEIGKNDEGKLACGAELASTLKKGDPITAFVKFFAPRGGKYDDLEIRFLLNGEVRSSSAFTVSESWTGYANYKKTTAGKAGEWEIQVLRADTVLGSKKVTVN